MQMLKNGRKKRNVMSYLSLKKCQRATPYVMAGTTGKPSDRGKKIYEFAQTVCRHLKKTNTFKTQSINKFQRLYMLVGNVFYFFQNQGKIVAVVVFL